MARECASTQINDRTDRFETIMGDGRGAGSARARTGWKPPTDERVPIHIHPKARIALAALLERDPRFQGVEYSEFIMNGADSARAPARWNAPTDERVPIHVHPEARTALAALLKNDPRFQGVGYSAFIMNAVHNA